MFMVENHYLSSKGRLSVSSGVKKCVAALPFVIRRHRCRYVYGGRPMGATPRAHGCHIQHRLKLLKAPASVLDCWQRQRQRLGPIKHSEQQTACCGCGDVAAGIRHAAGRGSIRRTGTSGCVLCTSS